MVGRAVAGMGKRGRGGEEKGRSKVIINEENRREEMGGKG